MKRKCMMATVVLTLVMMATGCGSGQEPEGDNVAISTENDVNADETGEHNPEEDAPEEDETQSGEPDGTEQTSQGEEAESADDEGNGENIINVSDDAIFIGGHVRSVSQDSFVLSRTLLDDDGMIIAMPEAGSPEEELVTVRCTDSTVYEWWTIRSGGGSIDKEETSFSELKESAGVEALGRFDGEEFIAEKVIIEVYE
ncbi:MAG: hypothetical protein K2L82_07045 [Lachnospiraceae bacterium]|nr:hypothetical protein [Lachnospiraceae bacterium]